MADDELHFSYRLAQQTDAVFLRSLADDLHGARLAPLGLPAAALQQLLDLQDCAQRSGYAARFPDAEQRVYSLTGGLFAGEPFAQALIAWQSDALRLVHLAVTRAHRGQGLGTRILQQLMAEAAAAGLAMRLEVEPGNRAAQLYQRLGFIKIAADDISVAMEHRA